MAKKDGNGRHNSDNREILLMGDGCNTCKRCEDCAYPDCVAIVKGNSFIFSKSEYREVMRRKQIQMKV